MNCLPTILHNRLRLRPTFLFRPHTDTGNTAVTAYRASSTTYNHERKPHRAYHTPPPNPLLPRRAPYPSTLLQHTPKQPLSLSHPSTSRRHGLPPAVPRSPGRRLLQNITQHRAPPRK